MTEEKACSSPKEKFGGKPAEVIVRPLNDLSLPLVPSPMPTQTPVTPTPSLKSFNGMTPPGAGRIKAPPICRIPALRKENMSAEQISRWCFKSEEILLGGDNPCRSSFNDEGVLDTECTDGSCAQDGPVSTEQGIHDDTSNDAEAGATATPNPNGHVASISPKEWEYFKRSILQHKESRNGRQLQRFATDAQTGHLLRLTTGSVPIMSDGRILLVSSSRKEEWILPKGGWESDETLEISALRESYEEAGILGTLGTKLTDIEYETRKAKKRRLEMESLTKVVISNGNSSAVSVPSANSSVCHSEDDFLINSAHTMPSLANATKDCIPARIKSERNSGSEHGDTASLGSIASLASDGSGSWNYVRMSMFPLYVLEARTHWPESGRARKIVDIDTAIVMMQKRPEFQKVLIEVKEKGYHLAHNIIKARLCSVADGSI